MNVMKTKQCVHCKKEKPTTEFNKCGTSISQLQSWCKVCAKVGFAKRKGRQWAVDGFENADDHFNAALELYAKLFDCPELVKHKTHNNKINRHGEEWTL